LPDRVVKIPSPRRAGPHAQPLRPGRQHQHHRAGMTDNPNEQWHNQGPNPPAPPTKGTVDRFKGRIAAKQLIDIPNKWLRTPTADLVAQCTQHIYRNIPIYRHIPPFPTTPPHLQDCPRHCRIATARRTCALPPLEPAPILPTLAPGPARAGHRSTPPRLTPPRWTSTAPARVGLRRDLKDGRTPEGRTDRLKMVRNSP
jgi:hypothetical protein